MSIYVLYGSETGNSQEFAEVITNDLLNLVKLSGSTTPDKELVVCSHMDGVSLGEIAKECRYLIVICSTTGQGDVPRNALRLWKEMRRKTHDGETMKDVSFASYGLGDSSYPKFNWAIRKIHKRLLQLGATEFADRGEADDLSGDAEYHFDEWKKLILQKIASLSSWQVSVPDALNNQSSFLPRNTLEVVLSGQKVQTCPKSTALTRPGISHAKVESNNQITAADHFQDVRKLKLIPKNTPISYEPGDTIALFPTSNLSDVEALIKHQKWEEICDLPVKVSINYNKIEGGLVKDLTLRNLLIHHLDISSIPRRSFFMKLQHFASEERERERLQEFCSVENVEDLYNYANRPRRSIFETITEFDSISIPPERILDLFPTIRPRLFSIASYSTTDIDLAIALVKYKTILRRVRQGLCSRWIRTLKPGDSVPFVIHKTAFKIATDRPMILIATGTGIAPIRSLLQSQIALNSTGLAVLFFGFRDPEKDYLFKEEWKEYPNLQVYEAISQGKNVPKTYVQNKIFQYKKEFKMLVDLGATVYLCGSSGAMPKQVRITIEEIIGEPALKEMEMNGRYIQETW